MSQTNLIIFSYNRPMQLHGLLDSIFKFAPEAFRSIVVIFKSDIPKVSYDEMVKGYASPKANIIRWVRESANFKNDVISAIDHKCAFTCFMVDDILVYGRFNNSFEDAFTEQTLCFSLRLGINCVYSHPADEHYNLKNYMISSNFISWFWRDEKGDFRYPLSLDGHVFRTNMIHQLIIDTDFENPNTLEVNLQSKVGGIEKEEMISYRESKIVGIPVNKVNKVFDNRFGLYFYHSIEELNKAYLFGKRIDQRKMDFTSVNGPHKEIELKFSWNGI